MRVGIVGAGGMGNVHARQYAKMPDVSVCVFDVDSERAERLAAAWGAEVVADESAFYAAVDAVDVCLPSDLHHLAGARAIEAGKPVLLEKPATLLLDDGLELLRLAEAKQAFVTVGQVVRYFPEFATGHRQVKAGAVGRPASVRTRRGGTAPTGSAGWFMDHAKSGGVLIDLAIHDFDWIRWTFGEVVRVTSRSVAAQTGGGPDYALTTLTLDSGVIAHVEATWMDPGGFRTTFEVAGSEGVLEFDSRQTPSLRAAIEGRATALESNQFPLDDPYYLQLRAFVDAAKAGQEPPVPLRDGLKALAIAEAALHSARTGEDARPRF